MTLDGGTPQPKTTAASVVSYYLALRDLRFTTTGTRQTLANAQSTRVVNLATVGTSQGQTRSAASYRAGLTFMARVSFVVWAW